jgi:hypothetical protein
MISVSSPASTKATFEPSTFTDWKGIPVRCSTSDPNDPAYASPERVKVTVTGSGSSAFVHVPFQWPASSAAESGIAENAMAASVAMKTFFMMCPPDNRST